MALADVNLVFAWWWMTCGALSGAAAGLVFHREDACGGYASWRRRLMRLGHVAFFGTGLLNLGFALTARAVPLPLTTITSLASLALLAGAMVMPVTCYLASWRASWRILFVVPVVFLVAGLALSAVSVMQSHS
ncbi:MAG TPA: hypothetical protein VMS30_00980 [Phycisphaerales bacterium]|nr:hypothetical protein [Phycisphaerales bacterium]